MLQSVAIYIIIGFVSLAGFLNSVLIGTRHVDRIEACHVNRTCHFDRSGEISADAVSQGYSSLTAQHSLTLTPKNQADPTSSAIADFKKMNAVYAKNFSVTMSYFYYPDHTSAKFMESSGGSYLKIGENSYSNLHNVETMRNARYTIVADNNENSLVVLDPYNAKQQAVTFGIDTLLHLCDKIEMQQDKSGRTYTLHLGSNLSAEFSTIKVVINPVNYALTKLVLYYKSPVVSGMDSDEELNEQKPPRVEVIYKNFNPAPVDNPELFREDRFIKVLQSKKYKGTGKYSNYTVYNQKLK
ncbi:MAG: hypothetical protein JST26_11720 [Bacteroidetes bacterium]|nr:hypothetical protein [Bacteroidota bacterium]